MSAPASLLVVDDEDVVCRSCSRIFERHGFTVETSTSPHEGLRLAAEKRYSAVLLDIMMPEIGGIEFLERLRAMDPAVPVIIITGYSSVPSAAEAMRLRAADYIPKPFTPEEISEAVARVVPFPRAVGPAVEAARAAAAPAWEVASGDFQFLGRAWCQLGRDGTVRVGAYLPREETRAAVTLRSAAAGEVVYRGLPLAELALADGRRRLVPAPVSGEVLELNGELAEHPDTAWNDPCRRGWIARVRPHRLAEDMLAGRARRLVLACADPARARAHRGRLAELGCEVVVAHTAPAVLRALRGDWPPPLFVDADSLAEHGPELVQQVVGVAPTARIVVLAPSGLPFEAAYRTQRILYYAVEAFADQEIIDVVDAAFRLPEPVAPALAPRVLPGAVRLIRVTNRHLETVALMAGGGMLHEDQGLGRAVIQRLLDRAHPLEVTLGTGTLAPPELWRAERECDRVVRLLPEDRGRLPGSLSRAAPSAGEARVTTLVVQPTGGPDPLAFPPDITDALAALIVAELSGPPT